LADVIDEVKREAAAGTHLLAMFGLSAGVRASLGHVSVRVPGQPDRFVVKGRGYRTDALPAIRPEDMVVVDMDGVWIDGPRNVVPCFEVKIHSCILRDRPDVNSVVHVHPKYSVLLSVLQRQLKPMAAEGARLVLDPIPVYPRQKIITTEEEGTEVAKTLAQGSAELLFGHGAVTVGASMEQAIMSMVQLEHQAEMNYLAELIDGRDHGSIPRELVLEATAGGGRSQFELAHFKESFARAGAPKYSGAWGYWMDQAYADMT
jgi:ribulose-5-phosphate 4-epimerase/fuculose-1-phosphate aldolase